MVLSLWKGLADEITVDQESESLPGARDQDPGYDPLRPTSSDLSLQVRLHFLMTSQTPKITAPTGEQESKT